MANPRPIAVIGCGAISELTYLPALARRSEWRAQTWLVEPNLDRGRALAERFGFVGAQVVPDLRALPRETGLAVNATPSHLHVATTLALLANGINVVVEKPFAETAKDARGLVEAARGRALLAVNQSRRFGPSNQLAQDILRSGTLGTIKQITWAEGRKFDWPTQSGFNFRRPWQGRPRGVVLDIGVHVLDLLYWWLDERPVVVAAEMDGHGGPEASVSARLAIGTAALDMRLSYLVRLDNQFVVHGTNGAIRGSTADYDRLEIQVGSGPWRTMRARGSTDAVAGSGRLIENMLAAAAGAEPLLIDAETTLPALAAVDDLYARAHEGVSACYRDFLPPPAPAEQENRVTELVA